MRKKLAVVLAADNASSYALAVTLLSFKKNSPALFNAAEFFVFTQDISAPNKAALQKTANIQFKNYKPPFDSSRIKTIKRYTELTLARYECFYMLEDYQNVLWLDIDILVMRELEGILSLCKNGMALANDLNLLGFNFFQKPASIKADLRKPNFNAGVMLLNGNLKNPKETGDWCYAQTRVLAPLLRWPDQAVINLALQHFDIKADILPPAYNAHPFSAPVPAKDAFILHAMGANKFWNNCRIPFWFKLYGEWLAAGGQKMPEPKTNIIYLLIFKTKLFVEKMPFLWAIFNKINKYKFKKLNERVLAQVENI